MAPKSVLRTVWQPELWDSQCFKLSEQDSICPQEGSLILELKYINSVHLIFTSFNSNEFVILWLSVLRTDENTA